MINVAEPALSDKVDSQTALGSVVNERPEFGRAKITVNVGNWVLKTMLAL